MIDLSSAFVYMLVVGGGGYMALSDQFDMDGASIIAFLIGLVIVFDPARNVAQFFTQLQSSLVLLESVYSIFDNKSEDFNSGGELKNLDGPISIKFENVNFSYSSEHKSISDLTLEFKPGTRNAIVGSTGSGKTTLLNLIGRLYEPSSGKIMFNDQHIKNLNLSSVREQITIVSQDIVIFDQSIEENIRYADPTATNEMVLEAAKSAKIIDLITERRSKAVGPNGSQLSGGQKQRIALARAFLKPAPILLLDEATSALDAVTEANIARSLKKLSKNRTTVVVAHKLSSIENADMIFVMENGQLIEAGNHIELMNLGKQYSKMVETQNKKNVE
jgi:ATP-binding cassette subfamily B protein/subfamily B ATP-binding cassette protein MsbA